jgi:hypothetical protein
MKRELVVTLARFFSPRDEASFFRWLQSVPCIGDIRGAGSDLHIELEQTPDDDDLRELIALFHRYHLDLTRLATFSTDANRRWLRDENAYWFERMFA